MTENYYEILRIAFDADSEAVKQAYRRLAQVYHPDKRTNKKFANHKFMLLSEAYTVLSDPVKRAEYDQLIVEPKRKSKTTKKKSKTTKKKSKATKKKSKAKRSQSKRTGKGSTCLFSESLGGDMAGAHCYRNGERHGKWEMRYQDGQVEIGEFFDGEKYGQWEERFANGAILNGGYVKGKRHGFWKKKFTNGGVQFFLYEMDKEKEEWTVLSNNESEDELKSEIGWWWILILGASVFFVHKLIG